MHDVVIVVVDATDHTTTNKSKSDSSGVFTGGCGNGNFDVDELVEVKTTGQVGDCLQGIMTMPALHYLVPGDNSMTGKGLDYCLGRG